MKDKLNGRQTLVLSLAQLSPSLFLHILPAQCLCACIPLRLIKPILTGKSFLFSCDCCSLGWPALQTDRFQARWFLHSDVCLRACKQHRQVTDADCRDADVLWRGPANHHIHYRVVILRHARGRQHLR